MKGFAAYVKANYGRIRKNRPDSGAGSDVKAAHHHTHAETMRILASEWKERKKEIEAAAAATAASDSAAESAM